MIENPLTGEVLNFDPDQPRDESGRWTDGSRTFLKAKFPRHKKGELVDGRKVRKNVDNLSSVESSLTDYEFMPGIRVVDTSLFPAWGNSGKGYVTKDDNDKTDRLTEKIRESNSISPLIVVVDDEGPYILEGGHRYEALRSLGAKHLPAKIVIDRERLPRKRS